MSDQDQGEEPTLQFFARQLLEINQSLKVLPEMQVSITETKQHLAMIQGWMNGQEEVSLSQARSLSGIHETLGTIASRLSEYGGAIIDTRTRLEGVVELSKSTFDIVTEIKEAMPGGEHETSKNQAATQ